MTIEIQGSISANAPINNDSYLIIVWGEDKDNVKILNFDDKKAQNDNNILTQTANNNSLFSGNLGGALKQVARFGISKVVPDAIKGRTTTALINIMNDGKITLDEVKDTFIHNATNELDKVAVDFGINTEELYDLLKNGGLEKEAFFESYTNASKSTAEEIISLSNESKSTANVLKIKFIDSDSEDLKSEIPERRTEKGFAYSDYIYNSLRERSFGCILGGIGINPFEFKEVLKKIRDSKIPFTVYVNDSKNGVQEIIENCLFSDLRFERSSELGNCIQCQIDLRETIQSEVTSVNITPSNSNKDNNKRIQKPSSKKISKNVSNKPKVKINKPKKILQNIQAQIDSNNRLIEQLKIKSARDKSANAEIKKLQLKNKQLSGE